MITIDRLEKSYGDRRVLAGVSTTFEQGQVTALVGPSGGGKSTLLRCINGLERFDAGSITVLGRPVTPGTLRQVRLDVGMVFQQYGLFAHMNALENIIEAPIHVRGEAPTRARERALALLEQVGLTHRKTAYPRELSGGEQQRVAIARALAMDPKALLLDEPTSALDPDRKTEVIDVLAALAAAGTTMILVSHEPATVRAIAHRAIMLDHGRIVREGTAAAVLAPVDDPHPRS
jgi:polar amino acid transport system ATP-binding protein